MSERERRRDIHELDATLRAGKGGVAAVADELGRQLDDRDLVKVKFLRAARADGTTAELAADLADLAGADVVDTRGHTAVFA